jgi:hypothetical protein
VVSRLVAGLAADGLRAPAAIRASRAAAREQAWAPGVGGGLVAITTAAPRSTSSDIRRHEASNYQAGHEKRSGPIR